MADFKRRMLTLSTGKQIKLFGNSMAIGKSLEIGEGYKPNIFSCSDELPEEKTNLSVSNPYKLNKEELIEMADYNIQLWMNLKSNLRKYEVNSPKVFSTESNSKEGF